MNVRLIRKMTSIIRLYSCLCITVYWNRVRSKGRFMSPGRFVDCQFRRPFLFKNFLMYTRKCDGFPPEMTFPPQPRFFFVIVLTSLMTVKPIRHLDSTIRVDDPFPTPSFVNYVLLPWPSIVYLLWWFTWRYGPLPRSYDKCTLVESLSFVRRTNLDHDWVTIITLFGSLDYRYLSPLTWGLRNIRTFIYQIDLLSLFSSRVVYPGYTVLDWYIHLHDGSFIINLKVH